MYDIYGQKVHHHHHQHIVLLLLLYKPMFACLHSGAYIQADVFVILQVHEIWVLGGFALSKESCILYKSHVRIITKQTHTKVYFLLAYMYIYEEIYLRWAPFTHYSSKEKKNLLYVQVNGSTSPTQFLLTIHCYIACT